MVEKNIIVDPSKNMYFEKLLKNGKNEGKKIFN